MEDTITLPVLPLLCFGTSDRFDKDVEGKEVNSEHTPLHLCVFPPIHSETGPCHLVS